MNQIKTKETKEKPNILNLTPKQVREFNNKSFSMDYIKTLFNDLNEENSNDRVFYIPFSLLLRTGPLIENFQELITVADSNNIHFDKHMEFESIYLICFNPIRGGKYISIWVIKRIGDFKAKRTRKKIRQELVFEFKGRKSPFNHKDKPQYLIFSKEWIDKSSQDSDNIKITLFDLFDEKKYKMGLSPDDIEALNDYEARVKEIKTLEYFDKKKQEECIKKKLKKLRKERKKERKNSAKKIQKWYRKNKVYYSNLMQIKLYFKKQFVIKIQKCWEFMIEKKKQIMIEKKKKSVIKIQTWWIKIMEIKYKRLENIINLRKKKITSKSSQRYNPNAPEYFPKNEPS